MFGRNAKPELEVFDLGMINYSRYLIHKGFLRPPYDSNLILENIVCSEAETLHLGLMVKELPEPSIWSVGGVGNYQMQMNLREIISKGEVRIGLEDNI
jgi:uncharacterized protein (DUF849 family)